VKSVSEVKYITGLLEHVNQCYLFSVSVRCYCWTLESLVLEPMWFMGLPIACGSMKPLTWVAWDFQQHTETASTLVN